MGNENKGVDATVLSPGVTNTPMSKNEDIDWSKAPFSTMSPEKTAELGLKGLRKKPPVAPGTKNRVMMFTTTRLTPVSPFRVLEEWGNISIVLSWRRRISSALLFKLVLFWTLSF